MSASRSQRGTEDRTFLDCTYHHAGNINGDPPLIDHPDWYYD
ncbi:MAG: hypothetical protein ACP5D4_11235 [Baaleninema sp.]